MLNLRLGPTYSVSASAASWSGGRLYGGVSQAVGPASGHVFSELRDG